MNPSTPTYDPVICMMRKNREAAWMIDDLSPEMVVVPDDGFDFLDLSQQKLLAIHALKSISLKWARLKSQIVMLGKTNIWKFLTYRLPEPH